MTDTAPGAEALMRAREQAATELALPVDNNLVQRFAVLSVAHEAVQALIASGHITDSSISNLLRLDEALAAIRAQAPKKPIQVEIEIIDPKCPRCGYRYSEGPTPLIEGKAEATLEGTTAKSETLTTDVSNGSAVPSEAAKKIPPPPPKQSPKWVGEGDQAFMPAVDHAKDNPDLILPSPWHTSQSMLGAHGGPVRGNGKLPGTPDHGPAPVVEGRKP